MKIIIIISVLLLSMGGYFLMKKNYDDVIFIDVIPERGNPVFFSHLILYVVGENSPQGLTGYSGIDVNDIASREDKIKQGFEERNQFEGRTILILKNIDGSFRYPTYFSSYKENYGYYSPEITTLERKSRLAWRIRQPEPQEKLFLVLVPDKDDRIFVYQIDWEHQMTIDKIGNKKVKLKMPPPEQLPQIDEKMLNFVP